MASTKKPLKAVEDVFYLTPEQHLREAERLTWVLDDILQSDADRTLADVAAIARLHLDLAQFARRASE